MTPLEFLARLSALIPPPRRPAFRYHGAFAPAAEWRKLIVPASNSTTLPRPGEQQDRCRPRDHVAPPALRPERESSVRTRPTHTAKTSSQALASDEAPGSSLGARDQARATNAARRSSSYIHWPSLMLRSYAIDVLKCPTCDGRMTLIAAITERDVAERILTHLRLPLDHRKFSAMVTPSRTTSPASPSSTQSSRRTMDPGSKGHPTGRSNGAIARGWSRTCSLLK
jgi:hypothetical protein